MSIDTIPIWAVLVATFFVVMAALELGYLMGRAIHRRSEDEKESPVSAIAGAILGLAAFMLAFTFGIVSGRYDVRKGLVRDDANAIRTAWLRADLLPEGDRAVAKDQLRRYLDVRLKFAEKISLESEHVKRVRDETQRIQDRLWNMAVAHGRTDMNSDVGALYLESLNEMNSVNASRLAISIQARVPAGIWVSLYIITFLGMMGVGYQTGIAGSRRSMARPFLAVSFALVFTVIASLDRPDSGFLNVTQQPLIDLRDQMNGAAAPADDN